MIPPPIGPDLPGEIWKPIPGFEHHAEISNKGRLRSTPRKLGHEAAGGYLMANLPGPVRGYGRPRSRNRDKHAWQVPVHQIMASVFLGDHPIEKTQINHKDGNKLNNSVDNLEYCTPSENTLHAYAMGLNPGNGPKRKLTPALYDEIRDLYRQGGWTHEKLAVKYGVTATHIGYVLHRSKATARDKFVPLPKAR